MIWIPAITLAVLVAMFIFVFREILIIKKEQRKSHKFIMNYLSVNFKALNPKAPPVTTEAHIKKPKGKTRSWIPSKDPDYLRKGGITDIFD